MRTISGFMSFDIKPGVILISNENVILRFTEYSYSLFICLGFVLYYLFYSLVGAYSRFIYVSRYVYSTVMKTIKFLYSLA